MSVSAAPVGFGHGGARPYDRALVMGGALYLHGISDDRAPTRMDVDRYAGDADAADLTAIGRAAGAVIDLGCGPGRMVRAAIASGHFALGIDVSPTAVAIAQDAGLPVLCRDIDAVLPLEGRWGTALLIDGNIGIGGDPARLLDRVRALLDPRGRIIVETSAGQDEVRSFLAEVRDRCGRTSAAFPWAQIGSTALARTAAEVGLRVEETWSHQARTFLALTGVDGRR
ncbi:class I SAM-dependent methyltransferase [Brevibacterium oceani]|uniref:class I SAM-dependent methyltransferase n=1 Tax=Brevibacterium oceani TaxID=358099 RepID=UPI0015E634BF|nr:methyltransferase domain-containing protein [Brevibacterium oceani]